MGLIDSLSTGTRQRLEAIATEQRCRLGFRAFNCLPARILDRKFRGENLYT